MPQHIVLKWCFSCTFEKRFFYSVSSIHQWAAKFVMYPDDHMTTLLLESGTLDLMQHYVRSYVSQ